MNIENQAELYDTGEWHLTVYFSCRRGMAFLRNIAEPTAPVRMLLDATWNAEGTALLREIEKAVYEHPAILDDYSADIIVATPDTLWVPAVLCDDEDALESCYTSVRPDANPADIMTETDDDVAALTTGTPGLRSFLARTFPGARVQSRAMVMLRRFRNYPGGGKRVYLHIEDSEAVITAFDHRRLIASATHPAPSTADACYALLLTMEAFALPADTTEVFVSGEAGIRREITEILRRHINYVMHTVLPSGADSGAIPLCALLASMKEGNGNHFKS